MDSNFDSGRPFDSESKSSIIKGIIAKSQKAFDEWLTIHPEGGLDIPTTALSFLVPPRVLELANDSNNVRVKISDQASENVIFYVVESMPQNITNLKSFEEAVANDEEEKPPDADYMHWESQDDVIKGIIQPNDFIYNKIRLELIQHGGYEYTDLFVDLYTDREELTGRGVASSFYNQLQQFARKQGFAYITGQNNRNNIGFFTGLGRTRLADLLPEQKGEFFQRYGERIIDPKTFTIANLNDEE